MAKSNPNGNRGADVRTITVDLLALDLTTCGRCTDTEANLDAAFETVAERLRQDGVVLKVRKTIVRTAEQAVRLRFASSPTIRVDGRDIALEFRESDCVDCGDICGGATAVDCRVWVWRGREYLEAPKEMVVEAVLRAYRDGGVAAPPDATPFRLPENLRQFFAAQRAAPTASSTPCCPPSGATPCCPSAASGSGEAPGR